MQIDLKDLHHHAQSNIDERSAWPKSIYVVASIPLTTIGKIFKPSFRCEAAKQKVADLFKNEFKITEAEVDVATGGPHGMCVTVTIPEGNHSDKKTAEDALNEFLFEAKIIIEKML